jgi:hypothetical protein
MVVDMYGKQQNKIAWRWTKQMAMTSIKSKKKNTPRVSLCTTTKRAALQRDKRFRIQSKTKLATNQNRVFYAVARPIINNITQARHIMVILYKCIHYDN